MMEKIFMQIISQDAIIYLLIFKAAACHFTGEKWEVFMIKFLLRRRRGSQ